MRSNSFKRYSASETGRYFIGQGERLGALLAFCINTLKGIIMDDLRVLCDRCKRDYEAAGYIVKINYLQTIKDTCEICGVRSGFEYIIEDKRVRQDKIRR